MAATNCDPFRMKKVLQPNHPRGISYHFIVPVWGAKYVEMFAKQSLPSQLAPGNIPSLPAGRTSYQIFTHAEDADAIWHSSSVRKLRGMIDVSLTTFTDKDVNNAYGSHSDTPYNANLTKMSWCYDQGIKSRHGVDTAFIFITPDSVWGNGAFRYVHQCQCSGVRALMALGLITLRPVVQQRLEGVRDGDVLEISPQQLVKLACDALHPLGAARIVRDGGNGFPCAYYWMKPGKGLVARCFYLHPVMVRPLVHLERLPSTVDYRYVRLACPDRDRVRIVTDSDDLFYIDMADVDHEARALVPANYSHKDQLDWMCQWTDDYHRAYFRQAIVLRENDGADPFNRELAASATFADNLLKEFERHQPVCGKRFFLSNIFPQDRFGDAAAPLRLSGLRRAAGFVRRLPYRFARRVYHVLLDMIASRIQQLDGRLCTIENELQKLARHVRSTEVGIDWKSRWIRTEYELRREISILRADLEQAREKQADSDSPRGTGKRMRLVGGSSAPSVRSAA
jgi:hypothetical protein